VVVDVVPWYQLRCTNREWYRDDFSVKFDEFVVHRLSVLA
jgi:hypothetical protein